jgi:hypothetical protein
MMEKVTKRSDMPNGFQLPFIFAPLNLPLANQIPISMNSFNIKAAQRIGAVSVLLALLVSPIAWHIAQETAEKEAMSLAMEESQRILAHLDDFSPNSAKLQKQAEEAARMITGGLFDIAEIYDGNGKKLAESTTPQGHEIEPAEIQLPFMLTGVKL